MSTIVDISSEGGPLLIADATAVDSWSGVDGSDYERACEFFDIHPGIEGGHIDIGRNKGILWEMKGGGTAYVFPIKSGGFTIIRVWLSDPEDEHAIGKLAGEPISSPTELGVLDVESGSMVVIWAAENGACIRSEDIGSEGRPTGEMAIDDAGYIFKVPNKRYQLWHDDISSDLGVARRCHIKPI